MKKTISILTSLLIIFSFSLSAQTVASNIDKKTNDTEYSKSEVKENKKPKGFNFFKSKKSAKNASCCASKKTTECASKKEVAKAECSSNTEKTSCSETKAKMASKSSSCCASKNNSQASRNAAAKVRQAIAKGEITVEQGNARLARLQKGSKK